MHSNRWLFFCSFVAVPFCEINKHLLSIAPAPFSIPSLLSCHHPFSEARSSQRLWWGLHGGLSLIAGELKEAGWLHQPCITFLLPPLSLHGLPSGIPALRPSSCRSQMEHCFVPSALLSSVPLPAQALRWKITFWGQTLIILLAPRAPSARLIILALRDENLELLFSSYQSRRLQALSVDKDPVSVYDREQRGCKTNRLRACVSQNLIAEVFRAASQNLLWMVC